MTFSYGFAGESQNGKQNTLVSTSAAPVVTDSDQNCCATAVLKVAIVPFVRFGPVVLKPAVVPFSRSKEYATAVAPVPGDAGTDVMHITTSSTATAIAAVPTAVLENVATSASADVPVVPRRRWNVRNAVPAAVFVRRHRHRMTLPAWKHMLTGTGTIDPLIVVSVAAEIVCGATFTVPHLPSRSAPFAVHWRNALPSTVGIGSPFPIW